MASTTLDVPGFPVTLAFANNGIVYLSERLTGRLWESDFDKVGADPGSARVITEFSVVPLIGYHESGFTGFALDPDFEKNGLIYCFYTHHASSDSMENRVARIRKDGTGREVILQGMPGGRVMNGGILAFGPDGTLYIGNGHADDPAVAQDLNSFSVSARCTVVWKAAKRKQMAVRQ